jgi:putative hydrolase of the HAD superfamily
MVPEPRLTVRDWQLGWQTGLLRCATISAVAWLICDYGEVLCVAPPAARWEALVEASRWDRGRGEFRDAYWTGRPAYDRGDVSAAVYWRGVLGRPIKGDELDNVVARDIDIWTNPHPPAVAAVARAKDRGLRLALLSNAPLEVADAVDSLDWLSEFEVRLFSCRLREVKPDPEIFRLALAALGAEPGEVVFVDDRPANVSGAQALGIRSVLFTDPSQIDHLQAG